MTPAAGVARYRDLLRPSFLTVATTLALFGVTHMLFITWVADRSDDPSLAARLALMLFAPVFVGVPFAFAEALVGAAAWRATRASGRLRSWRYGAALSLSLLPPVGAWAAGSVPDSGLVTLALVGGGALLALAAGAWAGGARGGALLGLAALPFVGPWTGFLLGAPRSAWVALFVASWFALLALAGALMERWAAPEARAA